MLIDYIRSTASRIIADKETAGRAPAVCTLDELMTELREDATECLRQLCRSGEFRPHVNINRVPMVERNVKPPDMQDSGLAKRHGR